MNTKKMKSIYNLNSINSIDIASTGYVPQLFSIFNNNDNFCFKKSKSSESILCGRKKHDNIKELKPFVYITINNINEKNIFDIIVTKYKEYWIYDCECRKNSKEAILYTKVKYFIEKYPNFLIILFDISYSDLNKFKNNIYKISEDPISLNLNKEYKLKA